MTSPRRLLAKQRQAQALQMRLAGAEYQAIADAIGYKTAAGAFVAVQAAMKRGLEDSTGHELFMILRRLDRLLLTWWTRAISGDATATTEARAILAERAKLLGLYPAPGSRRQEHIDEDLLRQEARHVAERMGLDPDAAVAEVELMLRDQR